MMLKRETLPCSEHYVARKILAICLATILAAGVIDVVAAPSAQALADINALIEKIESNKSLRFIRNDKEYSGAYAAEFLRRKWKEKCAQAEDVEQFIEQCATKSSTSGQPYQVKTDAQARPAAEWLRELAVSIPSVK